MKTASPDLAQQRCQYRTRTGRQCTSRVLAPRSRCPRHAAAEPRDFEDFEAILTRSAGHFLNAQGINYSLASLFKLLASGRISPRRASVLAYISNLLLRTLTAIDKDACPEAGKDSPRHRPSRINPSTTPGKIPACKEPPIARRSTTSSCPSQMATRIKTPSHTTPPRKTRSPKTPQRNPSQCNKS